MNIPDSHREQPGPVGQRPVPEHRKPFPHPSIPGAMLVPLTRGRHAVIDECDAEAVSSVRWCIDGNGRYAVNTAAGMVFLHRLIWRLSAGVETPYVDHVDRDHLNCRRGNLRAATPSQNIVNSKVRRDNRVGLKGVTKIGRRWRAQIRVGTANVYLGSWSTPGEAHAAFMKAATARYGEFARAS